MQFSRYDADIFVRLDPGEPLIKSLETLTAEHGIEFAVITSGVGMVKGLELGFFEVHLNDYVRTGWAEIFDLSSVTGNVARFEDGHRAHVHVVVNRPDFHTLSGHLIECHTHITMEIGLREFEAMGIRRSVVEGCPATRLIRAPGGENGTE